jgi:uncharacterized membrane protein YkoI
MRERGFSPKGVLFSHADGIHESFFSHCLPRGYSDAFARNRPIATREEGASLPIMNAKAVLLVTALVAAGVPSRAQDQKRVTTDELPAPVQRALNASSKGEPVKSIHRQVIDGRTVYDVELERNNALNPRFRITEDGVVLAGKPPLTAESSIDPLTSYDGITVPAAVFDPIIPLEELPPAVRETIKKEAAGRPIVDVDREIWQGRTVFEVEFKATGRNPQIHVAEDGTVVKDERRRGELATNLRNMFMGTQLEDTPPAVQETVRRERRQGAINDIDIERRSGRRVYEVEINDGQKTFQLHVAEDGRVLHDTRHTSAPVKRG